MAYYQVLSFYYDDEIDNIFIQYAIPTDVSYEFDDSLAGLSAYNVYEAQFFLDGGSNLVGKFRPGALDGSFPSRMYGRNTGTSPAGTVLYPVSDAPE